MAPDDWVHPPVARVGLVSSVSVDRERDSAELPETMRRDVRLLGDILGEVISESDGPDLLADVERLRHAVIDARRVPDRGVAGGGRRRGRDRGARRLLVPAARRAGRPRLHRLLPPGQPGGRAAAGAYAAGARFRGHARRASRSRTRSRGSPPSRASTTCTTLLAGLRVHPVFTAHPTEARRRAVVASLRRLSGLLTAIDDQPSGVAQQAEVRRRLREEVDLLWRTAQLRVAGMTPADEVRTVMTAFDETLFRLVPAVYRAIDHVLLGPDSGVAAPPVPAFLRFGCWVGGDRDGNPTVTAAVTREAALDPGRSRAARAGGRDRQDRPGADRVPTGSAPPSAELRRALAAASAAHPELLAEITASSPQRALPRLPAVRGRAPRRDALEERSTWLRRAGRIPRRPAPGPVVAGGGRRDAAGLRGAAAPDLAGGDVRVPPRRP